MLLTTAVLTAVAPVVWAWTRVQPVPEIDFENRV